MDNLENPFVKLRAPLSIFGVIGDTINTIIRNRRPLKVILCLVILASIQFEVATRYDLESWQGDFSLQISYRGGGNRVTMGEHVTRGVREQLLTKFHLLLCSCFLFLCSAITTIPSSYEAYTGRILSIKDAFLKVSRNWKRPLLTSGCILLLTLAVYIVYALSFAMISILAGRSCHTSSGFSYIEALKWICNAYMAALWMMSLVVSVLESNISGLKAIDRARDLMKGIRIQASIVMMHYYIICLVAGKTFEALLLIFEEWVNEDWVFEEWAMWGIKITFFIAFTSLLKVFVVVFYTVLYHECKMNRNDDRILRDHTVADKSS